MFLLSSSFLASRRKCGAIDIWCWWYNKNYLRFLSPSKLFADEIIPQANHPCSYTPTITIHPPGNNKSTLLVANCHGYEFLFKSGILACWIFNRFNNLWVQTSTVKHDVRWWCLYLARHQSSNLMMTSAIVAHLFVRISGSCSSRDAAGVFWAMFTPSI